MDSDSRKWNKVRSFLVLGGEIKIESVVARHTSADAILEDPKGEPEVVVGVLYTIEALQTAQGQKYSYGE